MLIFLQRNLAWMLLAVALAASLWVVVTTQQNPDVVEVFQSIQVGARNQPPELVLRSEIPTVALTVAAPRDVWQELRPAKFQATVDLSRLGPGLQEVPVVVQTVDPRARIEDVTPARVLVHLEPEVRREVPARANVTGTLPSGYERQAPRLTPEVVVARGPRSLVDQVVAVVAEVDLSGVTASISQPYKVVPQNASGERIDRVSLSSENVLVDVRVDRQRATRTLPVAPQSDGAVAPGYQIAGLRAAPSSVTVEGLPETVDRLEYVQTQPLELRNATGDVQGNVSLQVPEGVRLVRGGDVAVTVFVSPVQGSKVIEVAPALEQVPGGMRASLSPPSVRLTLEGPMPQLTALAPSDVKITVNAAGLTAGTHRLRPQIELPTLVRRQNTDPEQVEVRLQSIETPTPVPTPLATRTPAAP
jgi:YbbR domain-containing protein